MPLLEYITRKEYIVTLWNHDDLDDIYDEIESAGKAPPNTDIRRAVECKLRRPNSRNTHYHLTAWEASHLRNDPRVRAVELVPSELGVGVEEYTTQTGNFDKRSTQSNQDDNWGLKRVLDGEATSGWGSDGTSNQNETIKLGPIGRNVDVVICDGNGYEPNHPEFKTNADGTGDSRCLYYNWYQHDPVVKGTSAATYSNPTGSSASYHAIHVMGTVIGNTHGWARAANAYNLYYYAGDTGNTNFPYVMEYIREFHKNKAVNPTTGRKNPTIVNNSWGMSLFSSDWSFDDITKVTFQGTTYEAGGGGVTTYTGESGLYSSSALVSGGSFTADPENLTQRLSTTGGTESSTGSFTGTNPAGWEETSNFQRALSTFTQPTEEYSLQILGPVNFDAIHNVAASSEVGTLILSAEIEVLSSDSTQVAYFSDVTVAGANVETSINETINLPANDTYTIYYRTFSDISAGTADDFLWATGMSATLETTISGSPTATVTNITDTAISSDLTGLTASTSPDTGNNDDGNWEIGCPWDINYLGTNYSSVYIGTNMYLTFGSGSTTWSGISPSNPALPKIMVGGADNSIQRIYTGTFNTDVAKTGNTYNIAVTNNGTGDWSVTSGTDRNGSVSGNDPVITIKAGDTITFTNNASSSHPLYIKTAASTGAGDQVGGATGQGSTDGGQVSWTPAGGDEGTYYYQCGSHLAMSGQIVVEAAAAYYRKHRLIIEGNASTSGTLGSPGMKMEYTFYEETPTQIDLNIDQNNRKTISGAGTFTSEQLNSWGFRSGERLPYRVAALDSDIEELLDEGVILVGAAGNGEWYHDKPGGVNWDNSFEMSTRRPGEVIYYHRGSSPTHVDARDGEYNNGAVGNVSGDGSDFFKREVTTNGVRIMGAGGVGGQTAVPDAWLEKVARMFELFTDVNGAGINETFQREFIKTLSGDADTYHAGFPTIQRVARGAGADYTPNFLTDAGIIAWNLTNLFDTHVQNDMVWYLNSTGGTPGDGDQDAQEVIEHVFHTLHMHGLPAEDIKLYPYISSDWATGDLYAAMEEAYDAGKWDPSGYQVNPDDWKTDGDAFEVAAKEYLYLLNFCMFEYTSLWEGGSLSPEWTDDMRTQAGILANNPLGYAFHNTYIAPVISKPSLATIRSIFQDGDVGDPTIAGSSGYVVGGEGYDNNTIVVGATESTVTEQKTDFSDTGPGVDIWAPGRNIQSSFNPQGTADRRDANYDVYKISGTSMASPQVCGVLACMLELEPNMTPDEAKEFLQFHATKNQLSSGSSGGFTDTRDLNGAPNYHLYYPRLRAETGQAHPIRARKARPASGAVYPRVRRRFKG